MSDLIDLSLEELITEYGQACADRALQIEYGSGRAVIRAEKYHEAVVGELRHRGYQVGVSNDGVAAFQESLADLGIAQHVRCRCRCGDHGHPA
jgi:hypothetical protein